jgi:hypothetical protein
MKPTNQDTINFIGKFFSELFNGFVFGIALIVPIVILIALYQWVF